MTTELKVVMFTDQIDSTSGMAERTPAEIRKVARDQQDLTAEAVRQCRGAVLKDTGDGHMIEFRSCADAVRCGFVIQQRVRARNDAQTNDRLKFDLHVGIDFGEAVVLENKDLRANAANLAARVSAKGPRGEVYFTEKVKNELHPREFIVEEVGVIPLKGVAGEVRIYRLIEWLGEIEHTLNPFIWRGGITRAEDFFDRDNEQRTLRAYLNGNQNCQIVGPRRIGKTSLLLQIERVAHEWKQEAKVAYLSLQDPRAFTLSGWLAMVSQKFGWAERATSLADFAERVEAMISQRVRPVLCMDEFREPFSRCDEFTRDFFLTLRSCGQQGMSIVTASQKTLGELTDPVDPTSPFYNTFPLLRLGHFKEEDAKDFIAIHRPGIPSFTQDEKAAVVEFAKGHPLALQVACFHVIEAKESGESLTTAMRKAADDMSNHIPAGW